MDSNHLKHFVLPSNSENSVRLKLKDTVFIVVEITGRARGDVLSYSAFSSAKTSHLAAISDLLCWMCACLNNRANDSGEAIERRKDVRRGATI